MRKCDGCLWEDICIGVTELECDDFTPIDNEYIIEAEYKADLNNRQQDYEKTIREFD